MAEVLSQTFRTWSFTGLGDVADINFVTGTMTGPVNFTAATNVLLGFTEPIGISAEDSCFFPSSNEVTNPLTTLPINADPPFPPSWPYQFSTGEIYGRDHLATNLKMIRGDTFAFDIAVILNGTAVNIAAATLTMTAKWDVGDADGSAVFSRSSATGGIVITDGPNGLATVTIISSNTTSLPAHIVNLDYDIQMRASNGNIYTVLTGTLSVYPDVTIAT